MTFQPGSRSAGPAVFLALIPRSIRSLLVYHGWLARWFSNRWRVELWRSLGATIGAYVFVAPSVRLLHHPELVTIGTGTMVDSCVHLHAWAPITVGKNVFLTAGTVLLAGSHDVHSTDFAGKLAPITIGDYAWLALGTTVLPGIRIGECAVVGARAVVTKDVPGYAIVAGNPATVVGERSHRPFSYVPADWQMNRQWQRKIGIRS